MRIRKFTDRAEAGRWLGERLAVSADPEALVLALPPAGVPVAVEAARVLGAPLDVLVVRELTLPRHQDISMGAVGPGNVRVLEDAVVHGLRVRPEVVENVTASARRDLERAEAVYRAARSKAALKGRTLLVVDDGMATGNAMLAAIETLRAHNPARIVAAVPVASADAYERVAEAVDELVCAFVPWPFFGIGFWYQDFASVGDAEAARMLREAAGPTAPAA